MLILFILNYRTSHTTIIKEVSAVNILSTFGHTRINLAGTKHIMKTSEKTQ